MELSNLRRNRYGQAFATHPDLSFNRHDYTPNYINGYEFKYFMLLSLTRIIHTIFSSFSKLHYYNSYKSHEAFKKSVKE